MSLRYEFDPQGNSSEDGHNDPLKTMFFTASEIVIREAFQNSLDAFASESPVHIEVNLIEADTKVIPQIEELKKIIKACANNKAGKEFYENAYKILDGEKINILKISDSNTTGLSGDDKDKEGKYYNFFKAVGGHYGAESGGSYGYGKSTNIAFSAISTFFATSKYLDQAKTRDVFMGGLRLVTHERNQKLYRGVGSFGKPGQLPVRDENEIPEFFRRKNNNPGTDIFIPAYRGDSDWKLTAIRATLKNFWFSIIRKKLIVKIGDEIIDSNNVKSLAGKYFSAEKKIRSWKKEDPNPYINAYLEGENISAELPTLGKVNLYIKTGNLDHSTGHVACFRKPLMLIFHKEFKSIIPYSGVFVCEDKKGNKVLQKLEMPQHNLWTLESDHAKDFNGISLPECLLAEKEYIKFVRENLEKLVGKKTREKIFLSSINDFIALKGQAEPTEAENPDQADDRSNAGEEVVRKRKTTIEVVEKPWMRGDIKPPEKICSVCGIKPCQCACSKCNQHPCICVCSKCTQKPCVCLCDKCNQKPCVCPKKDPPGSELKASIRTIPEVRNGELYTSVIIRTHPPIANKNIKIRLKAGTDEKLEEIEIKEVMKPAYKEQSGIIAGVKTDGSGAAIIEVKFEKNKTYALGATIYEN
jgi:hypothetical protein